MTEATPTGVARTAQIVRFLFKYRNAGVFSGLEVDAAGLDTGEHADEGRPEAFVDDLEAMGPTFIKIGQALSTRPDMVPPAYLVALERMQDDVAPAPFADIRAVIEEELGVKLGKLFESFEETPIGGASLAQVHRARLRDGRAVAVKVQRPGISDGIHADLDALAALARQVDRHTEVGRRTRFADWVHEFRRSLLAELDYRTEAGNLARFGAHFERYPRLFVPQPVWDLSARRVLTMELVEGAKATDIGGLRRTEQDMAPQGRQTVGLRLVEIDDEREARGGNRIGGEDADAARLDEPADPRRRRRDQLGALGHHCRPVVADEIAA